MKEVLETFKELPEETQKAIMPVLVAWFGEGCPGGLMGLEYRARMAGFTLVNEKCAC